MKTISLLQPWASLVVLGYKKIETRSWNTKFRGEILIHASKKCNNELYETIIDIKADKCLSDSGFHLTKIKNGIIETNLPLGAIIGKVTITGTFQFTEEFNDFMKNSNSDNERELAFGDFTPGRFGWQLSDPVAFQTPIPAKGQLGIWNYEFPLCDMLRV